jgi:hypothetical protein
MPFFPLNSFGKYLSGVNWYVVALTVSKTRGVENELIPKILNFYFKFCFLLVKHWPTSSSCGLQDKRGKQEPNGTKHPTNNFLILNL